MGSSRRREIAGSRTRRYTVTSTSRTVRIAILLIAVLVIVLGLFGFVSPDTVMALRREYVVNEYGMYVVAALRLTLGVLLIRFAPASRAPRILHVLGCLVCLQAVVQAVGVTLIDLERARAMLEWEARHPGLLRIGALIALAFGWFLVFAATKKPTRLSN